jgi:DUF917 family protein
MPRILEHSQLPMLALGFSLLGSGGGGSTTVLELALADPSAWPITVYDVDEVDPALPCFGAAFVGSTMILAERLPGVAPFAPLVAAAERWLGEGLPVVCSVEGGGLNGLVPLTFAGERTVVDADLSGRAVPGLDQMSLLVDRLPGVVATCDTGAGGVMLVQSDRPADVERVIRSAIIQAGGTGGSVFAGFTVADLAEHAIHGGTARALALGTAFATTATAPLATLAAALGGRLLGHGRITAVEPDRSDPYVKAVEVAGPGGEVQRIIVRSETLAFTADGRVVASAPTIIVVLDAASRDILEVTELTMARDVCVIGLPAPAWWSRSAARMRHVVPSTYGLAELDGAEPDGAG